MRALKIKGNRVYVNREKLNAGAAERLAMHIQNGWYVHESTEDKIEVYVLSDACPFRKRDVTKEEIGIGQMCRELIELAKEKQFTMFVDGVTELAYAYRQLGLQNSDFLDAMRRIESMAARESGNQFLPYEIRHHLQQARHERTGRIIVT